MLARGGVVTGGLTCPEGRCFAEEAAARRLQHQPIVEMHCLCHRQREWVVAKPEEPNADHP